MPGPLVRPLDPEIPVVRFKAPDHCAASFTGSATRTGWSKQRLPGQRIEMIVLDKKAKRFVFRYNIDCCTFCAQCVESCRQGSLEMASDEWELAALSRTSLRIYYGDNADVQSVLVGLAQPDAPAPVEG
jgi:NAD-dependent dihydropyrimidine dehydrogenase PreA subunit